MPEIFRQDKLAKVFRALDNKTTIVKLVMVPSNNFISLRVAHDIVQFAQELIHAWLF